MSVLRSQGVDGAMRPPRRKSSRGTNGDRRRVWRKGRISVHDRGACGATRDEIRQAGENYLRPHGRYGGDDEAPRSEEHTSELQSHHDLVCRLLLEKKKKK